MSFKNRISLSDLKNMILGDGSNFKDLATTELFMFLETELNK